MTKVLLADDDIDILQATARLLEALGFEVVAVRSAAKILAAARDARPDLILQDVNMPGLDIGTHMDALRADPDLRGLPVLLFSGGTEALDRYAELGADGFIEKPFDPTAIARVIESHAAKARDRDAPGTASA